MPREMSPAFQFYVKEWRSSRAVQRMSFALRGMYLEMLLEQWESFALPDTPAAMPDLIGGTAEEWETAWPTLRRNFVTMKKGIVNLRLERVRRELRAFKKVARKGGLARALSAKRGEHGTYLPAVAPAVSQPLTSTASSSSTASSTASAERSRERTWRNPGPPLIGRNPHLDHAACDESQSRCVPVAVHRKLADLLAPKYGGDREAAGAALSAWYPAVWGTLAGEFVMGEAFKFWQGRFDAAFASEVPTAAKRLTEDPATMDAGVAAILRKQGVL